MTRSPQAISSAAVRRHLEAAGPTVAQVLEAVTTEGAPSVGIQPLVDHVEQTKRWALESGSRHAAWLLYMAARSCLAQVPEYAADTEFVGGPVGTPDVFLDRYEGMGRRGQRLGLSLPRRGPIGADALPAALAAECVDVASAIRPEWLWLELQRALISMADGAVEESVQRFAALLSAARDESLRTEVLRNLLASAFVEGGLGRFEREANELVALQPEDRLSRFFRAACLAARKELHQCQRDLASLGGLRVAPDLQYWARTVDRGLPVMGAWLEVAPSALHAMIGDPA